MGFFSKIKENLQKGGVKVKLDSPGHFSANDQSLQIRITLTNSDTARTINGVRLLLEKEINDDKSSSTSVRREVVSSYNVPSSVFVLQSHEVKSFDITFPISTQASLQSTGNNDSSVNAVAGVLDKISQVADSMSNQDARYSVSALVDVEGISIDPSDKNYLNYNRPGSIGTVINF